MPTSRTATQSDRSNLVLRALAALVALVALLGYVKPAAAGELLRLRLNSKVVVNTPPVKLGDVLAVRGSAPAGWDAIAATPLWRPGQEPIAAQALRVERDDIAERLAAAGVNMADVLLMGGLSCEVTCAWSMPQREAPAPVTDTTPTDPDAPHETTLASAIRTQVEAELKALGGTAEVEFEVGAADALALATPEWTFTIRPGSGEKLGLRQYTVDLQRSGRFYRTVQIVCRVRLIRNVLVAARPLSVGATVSNDDLAVERRVFDQPGDFGLANPAEAIGRQIRHFIPLNTMLTPQDLRNGDIVQRSRPVMLVGGAGGVQVSTSGIALDSGAYGETIRVRLGDPVKSRREVRGVITGPGVVELSDAH